jgi:enoyl-CoA hydratase/carnithine racemase
MLTARRANASYGLGPRKTKELLLTGDSIDADEAHRLSMVSKVRSSARDRPTAYISTANRMRSSIRSGLLSHRRAVAVRPA